MSLRSKLLLIFSIFALGGPCALMFVAGWQTRQTGLSNYQESSRAQMERVNNYIELFFSMTKSNARYIADIPEVRRALGELPVYAQNQKEAMPSRESMSDLARAADEHLDQISRANPLFFGIGIGLVDGGFLGSPTSVRPAKYDPRTRSWYKIALAADTEESYGEPYRAATGNTPVCTAMARIRDFSGKVIGASYVNVNLDTLTSMLSSVRIGETGQMTLIDGTGLVIASSQFKDSVFTNVTAGKIPGLEDLLNLAPGHYVRDIGGVSRVVTLFTGFNDWRFIFIIDESEVAHASDAIILRLIAITLFLVVLSLTLGLLFARNLSRPILYLAGKARLISGGEFNVDIDIKRRDEVGELGDAFRRMLERLKEELGFAQSIMKGIAIPFAVVNTGGKLTYLNREMLELWGLPGQPEDFYGKSSGELLDGGADDRTPLDQTLENRKLLLNQPVIKINAKGERKFLSITASPLWDMDGKLLGACMMLMDETEIREQQDRIIALNERITTSVKDAHEISGRQGEDFNRLLQQLDKTSSYAQTQEQASAQTMESVTSMTSTLEMLASRAEQTTEDTRGTRAKAEEGREVVSKTVECIKKVAEYAERTAQSMLDLGVQADGINNIVELIKDIADQTNLLALNAAIEAARAGESGRGFAVVADEVRKLAEKTMHATEDVNKSISALQAEVSVNKELTEQTVNLTRTATNFAEQSGKSLEAIVDIADHAVEAVQFISAETVEQSRSGSAIVEAVRNISDMARETTQNMAESARFVTDLSAQSENLKKLVEAMGSDRRRSERFAPDYLCRATIMGLGDKPCLCRITDISTIGVRVELQEKLQEDDQGEAFVYVRSDEASLKDLLKNVPGKRIWRDGDFMGIEFESPLKANPAEFAQMLQSSGRAW